MNRLHKNQKAFTTIEILLLLIFLALIGFIGYYVYHNQHTTTAVSKNSTTTTSTTSTSTKANTAQDAVAFVQATYDKYIAAEQPAVHSTEAQPTGAEGLPAVQSSMTSELYTNITTQHKGGTGFACSPTQSVPSSAKATLSSSTSTQAIVLVSDGDSPSESVTVDLASMKITAIKCLNDIPA